MYYKINVTLGYNDYRYQYRKCVSENTILKFLIKQS